MLPTVDICASSVQVHLNIAQKVSKNEEVAEKICHLMSKLRKGYTSTYKKNVTVIIFISYSVNSINYSKWIMLIHHKSKHWNSAKKLNYDSIKPNHVPETIIILINFKK